MPDKAEVPRRVPDRLHLNELSKAARRFGKVLSTLVPHILPNAMISE